MKILILSSHHPADTAHGIGVIVFNTVRALIELGHTLSLKFIVSARDHATQFSYGQTQAKLLDSVATTHCVRQTSPRSGALRAWAGLLNSQERSFHREAFLSSGKHDLAIWFGHFWDPLTVSLASGCGCPILLHVNDSIALSRRYRSRGLVGRLGAAVASHQESSIVRRAIPGRVGLVYVAEPDRQVGSAMSTAEGGDALFCLPLAVDTEVFAPVAADKEREFQSQEHRSILLFTGTMSFGPNIAAARRLALDVLPMLPDHAQVRLVGRSPAPQVLDLGGPRVIVTGLVHNIVAEYKAADVFVAPMPPSAGMKNKILEAMACELPVVASESAISGFERLPPGVLIGDTDSKIAAHVRELIENYDLRRRMGKAAREFVLRHYRWISRTERLIDLLNVGERK